MGVNVRQRSAWIFGGLTLALAAAAQAAEGNTVSPPTAEDAPIALLIDMSSGQTLFAREADRRFMPASITKVMTTFLAFEKLEAKELFTNQTTTFGREAFRQWGGVGSTMYLNANDRVTVDALLHGVTTVSANDASVALAEAAAGSVTAWVEAMNAKASAIGMRDSRFGTPNGWMDEGRTFTTARDLTTLAQAMITRHPSKYAHFVGAREFEYRGITQPNHDPISGVVDGADGIKTGFTNQAGYGFLGSAKRNGRRLVMVVAASPRAGVRNRAARDFIEWGFSAFESRRLFHQGAQIGFASVQGGDVRSVGLVARRPVRVAVPQGADAAIRLSIRYEGPIKAPVSEGEEVASLHIAINGEEVGSVPLITQHAVLEANAFQRVFNGFAGVF